MMTYFVDLSNDGDRFEVRETDTRDTVYQGRLSTIGITENDPQFTNKLDDFLESVLRIAPDQWEVG